MAAADVVNAYLEALPEGTRRLGNAEWGVTIPAEQAGGWPLDIGLRIADGILRAQAFALEANDGINPWNFLHWNKSTRYIRFACTRAGDIWVIADLPVAAVDEREVDRLLGLVAEGAVAARHAVTAQASAPPEAGEGWGAISSS
jgi:hypothetical protein